MLSKDLNQMSDETKSISVATYKAAEEGRAARALFNAAKHQFTSARGWGQPLPALPAFALFFTADEFLCERRRGVCAVGGVVAGAEAGSRNADGATGSGEGVQGVGLVSADCTDSGSGRGGSSSGRGGLLRICKQTFRFEYDPLANPPAEAQRKDIVAVLGILHVHSEAFLVVVTAADFVGEVCGAAVWGVRKVEMLPFLVLSSPSERSRSPEVPASCACACVVCGAVKLGMPARVGKCGA